MTIDIKPIGYCSEYTLNYLTRFKDPIYSKGIYRANYALYDQAAIDALQARIAELEAPQEPVAIVEQMLDDPGFTMAVFSDSDMPVGTKLYARPWCSR